MELHGGLVSPEIKEKVREGELSQHIVCGVDVYRTPEAIQEDNIDSADFNCPCPFSARLAAFFQSLDRKYFTGRHYRLIDLLNNDLYLPFTDLKEVRAHMLDSGIRCFSYSIKETLESDDEDIAYVLSPLTKHELSDLMAWRTD